MFEGDAESFHPAGKKALEGSCSLSPDEPRGLDWQALRRLIRQQSGNVDDRDAK
jgi:hypothetical protein